MILVSILANIDEAFSAATRRSFELIVLGRQYLLLSAWDHLRCLVALSDDSVVVNAVFWTTSACCFRQLSVYRRCSSAKLQGVVSDSKSTL